MQVVYSVGARLRGGGFGNTAYYQSLGLEKAGFLKEVYATGFEPNEIAASKYRPVSLPVYFQNNPVIKDNLFDFLVSQKLKKAADFFHVWAHFGYFSLRKAKKMGLKTVLERASSHILTQAQILKKESEKWKSSLGFIHPWIVKKQLAEYHLADFIFVPSQFAYQSFLERDFPQSKLRLIPFGVDFERFQPQREKKTSEVFTALFVGQISLRKGVQYLLEAWQKLSLENARLILLGTIADDFQKIWQRYQNNPTIEHHPYSDPLPFYRASDCFVFPSLEEGSALVTYEAMACGLPSIVTFESGSLVEDQKEGLIVKSGDVDDLAQKLEYLYNHCDLCASMGKMAREKANNYSWQDFGERVVKNYTEIMDDDAL